MVICSEIVLYAYGSTGRLVASDDNGGGGGGGGS